MDEEVAAMKMGLRAVQLEHAVPNVEWPGRWFGLALPRLSYVAFVPCVAICLLLPLRVRQETGTPRVVMHADRGSDLEAVPRDSDINLIADAVDLSPGPVIVQVFDAQGAEVWKGKTLVQEDVAQIVLPPFRRGGWYILELGKRAANSRSELLREFVFYVR
ncbi:MAG: hypothetical protein JO340_06885 [Acidobacteriaceae bacterium]|nr:hypothetical protein [Acidobacteriaceae bacterium]